MVDILNTPEPYMEKLESTLIGPKVLLIGPSGTGKTFSIGTLVDWAATQTPPKPVYVLFTENGLETLLGYWRDRNLPVPTNLHWHVAMTAPLDLKSLIAMSDLSGKASYQALTNWTDNNRGKNNAYMRLLEALEDFPDDRTGKKMGNIFSMDKTAIFVLDSLTELANACMKMIIGSKPTASQPEYGVAQNNLINFLRLLTQALPATFVMTAHVDRQTDEISGTVKLMVKSIGKALAADIPPLFSDVILTTREAVKFYWDTAAANADTKTRSLPIQGKIEPNFGQIMNTWANRANVK